MSYQSALAKINELGYRESDVQAFIIANQSDPSTLMQAAASVGLTKEEVLSLSEHYGVNLSLDANSLISYFEAFNITRDDIKNFLIQNISSPDTAINVATQYGFTADDINTIANYLGLDYSNSNAQTVLANLEQIGIPEEEVYEYLEQHAQEPEVIYTQAAQLGMSPDQVEAISEALGVHLNADASGGYDGDGTGDGSGMVQLVGTSPETSSPEFLS